MKKVFLIVLMICVQSVYTQHQKFSNSLNELFSSKENSEMVKVWVDFTDKGNNVDYLLQNPHIYLTLKSIERRNLRGVYPVVDFSDLPVYEPYISEIKANGGVIVQKSKWFNSISVYLTKVQAQLIAELPFVRNLSPVARLRVTSSLEQIQTEIPGVLTTSKRGNSIDYGNSLQQAEIVNLPPLHNQGLTGRGITIAVMDAGFNMLNHESFDSLSVLHTWDFVNNDPDVGNGTDSGDGTHGTMVLSVLAGYKPGKLVGPAYGASYLLAKTENTDSETPLEEDNWIAAAEWADSLGADITSTSLIYLDFDPPYQSYTWQDMDGNTAKITIGAGFAVKKGIAVFNAVGNYGFNPDRNTLGAPADGDSVISIGGVNSAGIISTFSSVGLTIDGRIKPDVLAMGTAVYCAFPMSTDFYTNASGTSLSCPMIAGIAALLLENQPGLTPIQLRGKLRETASNSSPDRIYGWGIVNGLSALEYNPLSVKENSLNDTKFAIIDVFPYPVKFDASGINISIEIEKAGNYELNLFSSTGELISSISKGELEPGSYNFYLSQNNLSSGVYFIRLLGERNSKTIKTVILK